MTLTVSITPELKAQLDARASSSGQSLEDLVLHILEAEATAPEIGGTKMTGQEKAKAFRSWAESFPISPTQLSLEDVSRESIYQRD